MLCSSLEDNKAIPYLSGDVRVQDGAQHLSDHSQNTGDYPNVVEYIPVKHAEEEIKEYDDYRDERDSRNLINGGLGLFSWWKSEKHGKAKARQRTAYPTVTETTCPSVFGTTCTPAVETTCSSDIETNFPLVTEITFPLSIKTIVSPQSDIIIPAEIKTTCPPVIGTTWPLVIETICPPVIGNAFSSVTETICTPEMETTCPPVIETTCSPVIGNAFSSDTETICTPEMETTCPPVIETTCSPVIGNAFSSDTETICTPEMETTCTPDIETTCHPFIENNFSLDTDTICTPDTETSCPPYMETISNRDTELLCVPDTETTCVPNSPKIIISDTGTVNPDVIGASTRGLATIWSTIIYSGTMYSSTTDSITNGAGKIGSTKDDSGPIASTTNGFMNYSSKNNFGTIGSTVSSPGEIGSNLNSSGGIGSKTYGPGGIGSYTNGPNGISSNTNGTGGIGSITNGSGGIGSKTMGFETNGSTKYKLETIGSTVTSPAEIGSNTNVSGGIGSNTNGSGGIGSNTNGSGGIGSNTNASGGVFSNTKGPGGIGSNTNGLGGIGSNTKGPGGIGSNTNGHGEIGSNTNGPGGIGSSTNGPGGIGSNTKGPGGIGSNTISDGTVTLGTIGSNTNGLSTILAGTVGTARISSGASGAATTKSKKISSTTARFHTKNTVYTTTASESSNIDNDAADSTTADGDSASEAESDPFTIFDTTEESVYIRITVDPAAISTDPDTTDTDTGPADISTTINPAGISTESDSDIDADIVTTTSSRSTSSNSTSTKAYLTACYTITLECSPITIGTPVICDSNDIGMELTDAANGGTTTDRPTTATGSTGDSLSDVEDEAVSTDVNLNVLTTPSNQHFTDFIFGNVTNGLNTTAGMPPFRMLGAGMILPIYQIPLTPVKASPTGPSIQPKNVPFERMHYGRDSVLSKLRDKNIYNGQKSNKNKHSLLSKLIYKNQKEGVLKTESNHESINALEKHLGYKHIMFKERLAPLKSERGDSIFPIQIPGQLLPQDPKKRLHNTLNSYPYFVSALPTERPVDAPNVKKSYVSIENNIRRGENTVFSDIKNYISGFVKYNDTYLSQNSNISVNLVDLCKNVTCQGNNYLSQCCSRVCGPEKCEGEDFSYLHPIPGDTTTVTTTVKVLGPSQRTNVTYYTASFKSNVSDCSCNSKKKNSKAAKENDKKDFIKSQLMDGVTNPYQNDMIRAIKEENTGVQKEHKEVLSNDRTNVLRMNSDRHVDNSPIITNQRLSQEELYDVVSPYSSSNVLDDNGDISNGLLQSKQKHIPFQEDRYRLVRSLGLQNQIDCFKENNMILEKLKKDTEMELKRLSLLENKRREEELSFARERENELKELKTIQELIHREFESGVQGEAVKRIISDPLLNSIERNELPVKESTYTKLVRNIENYAKNDDINNFILNRYSSMSGIASNTVPVDKFPELEIKNSAGNSHGNALLVLNVEPGGEIPSEERRKRREGYYDSHNKLLRKILNL